MSAILDHLWFIVIPFGLMNVAFVYWRALSYLNQDALLKQRARIAIFTIALAITITAATVGVIQMLGGFNNPFYIYSADIANPYVLAGKIVILVFWIKVLLWAWFTDGLISYAKLFFYPLSDLQKMFARLGTTVVSLFGIGVLCLFHGSAVPIIINNYHGNNIEWITVRYVGGETTLNAIDGRTRAVMSIKPNRTSPLSIAFKMEDHDNAQQAKLPVVLSDVAMGYIDLFITQNGQIGVRPHLMFN